MTYSSAPRVLVVEDSLPIREALVAAFEDAGFTAVSLPDGDDFETTMAGFRPDVVILDVMLPGARDGFDLIDVVRQSSDAGIIMVTAKDQLADRLRGLGDGADDYVVKPFQLDEVVARAKSVLRRRGRSSDAVQVGDLLVDEPAGVVTRAGQVLDLTATELRLATFLVAQRGRTVSKTSILESVWGYGAYDGNLVEVHISALRRKMEAHGPRLIHTVRGLGYALRAPQ
ncbi:DNA-binding response regulator [Rhodococcus sp. 06-1477-1B]|uniref:response regulator transcription factor n=1 Tax=Rhodococcus sp. 06-1474-1B TaxID=2022499 RepID=UPI000B9C2CB4|nr:response regulator transcription factor [Rhodococcus sp. 06-1474-1B]OZD37076.1 DNA-binding response regulator [Rhodococcus sp. 06-1477-1B]OZD49190.1 DNA-binding response regulator [Rhodococcus sp. 06-1474-1B]